MGDMLNGDDTVPTIRCRALLNFRGWKYGKSYPLPDNEQTWMYIGMGLLEEEWEDDFAGVNDGPMLRGDGGADA